MLSGCSTAFEPTRVEIDLNSEAVAKSWKRWKRTFENSVITEHEAQENSTTFNKLRLLTNFVSEDIFEFTEDNNTYEAAVKILDYLFATTPNEIFACRP